MPSNAFIVPFFPRLWQKTMETIAIGTVIPLHGPFPARKMHVIVFLDLENTIDKPVQGSSGSADYMVF